MIDFLWAAAHICSWARGAGVEREQVEETGMGREHGAFAPGALYNQMPSVVKKPERVALWTQRHASKVAAQVTAHHFLPAELHRLNSTGPPS